MIPALPIDHLTILSTDIDASAAWYGELLPQRGFECAKPGIWRNANGLYLQFRPAKAETRPYERYGAGLNHFGFTAPNQGFVETLARHLTDLGY